MGYNLFLITLTLYGYILLFILIYLIAQIYEYEDLIKMMTITYYYLAKDLRSRLQTTEQIK